jgi:3-oxoacyl-[acyl-carrier-protein] synthase-3
MAFSEIKNIKIKAIAACVPEGIVDNSEFFDKTDFDKFVKNVGVTQRHVVDNNQCTSDLCYKSAIKIFNDLVIDRSDIEILIFVSHTADYKLPSTACILQDKLGLSTSTIAFDVTLGCSGFPYGLQIISSLMLSTGIRKGLLLVGNTQSKYTTSTDMSVFPLFADAGSAILLEYDQNALPMYFNLGTDGSSFADIIVPDGGARNPVTLSSFDLEEDDDGNRRSRLHERLNGMNVYSFGISTAPRSIKNLIEKYNIDFNNIDYFLIHQANKMMIEKIAKKLGVSLSKVPVNIQKFGNTSGATIPLLVVTEIDKTRLLNKQFIACGFGVGLSWGSVYFSLDKECLICDLQVLLKTENYVS